ncbi:hypothetical protein SpCBS45565_g07696 [Spizellomyces sp. 'palustris']|nr:hypothetical protein SpCBS45565_g07696 [Spizellomyces sp. 'palustris']
MTETMRAVVVKKPGNASGLAIDTVPKPSPKDDELLVKIHSFALNRMDILQRDQHYPVPKGVSDILGVEFAGIVEEIGPKVERFKKGDRVFGLVYGGAYAEYTTISERMAMSIPEQFTFQQAAAIPEVWFTAYQALFLVNNLTEGEDVLIHAGASGVGLSAIQLARKAKAKNIIVTAGHEDKLAFCKSLGATHGINYKKEDFQEKVQDITNGKGVNAIVDFIGAGYWDKNLASLAVDGRMVLLAFLQGAVLEKSNMAPILLKRLKIQGSTLRSRSLEYQIVLRNHIEKEVLPGLVDGSLKLIIDKEFGWTDIVDAHRYMESNQSMGKIVVTVTK